MNDKGTTKTDPQTRTGMMERVRSDHAPFDVLIVGGGATGLGAAVDAAARGYRVALLEQSDFAKGTSSRSTKLVHGGVRYLRQGNFSLVRAALQERGRLACNAPHLVRRTGFVIPSYRWWERSYYGLGMKIYDGLAGELGLGRSLLLSRKETLARIPTIETHDLAGGVIYYDGQFDDARLAISLALTAADLGAVVLNYCACVGLIKNAGRVVGVRARDTETGSEMEIRARVVINATGVFVDHLRGMDEPSAPPMVAVSRGIHLVVPRHFLPGASALMVPKTSDGRVFFAVPWHDRVVLGTTDMPVAQAHLEPRASQSEIDFVMEHAARYLSQDPADRDVLSVFAGLRPLVKAGVNGSTSSLSRDHTIATSGSGLLTITGGKWTTYRKMAQDVIDRAAAVANLPRQLCSTKSLRLHGAGEAPPTDSGSNFSLYGTDAPGLRALIADNPMLGKPLHPTLPYLEAEVVWHARHELARTVEDVLARRTRALILDAQASIQAAPKVARLLACELRRDASWVESQISTYTALARGYVFKDPASRASTI